MRGGRKTTNTGGTNSGRLSPTFTKGDGATVATGTTNTDNNKNDNLDTSIAFEDGITVVTSLPNPDHSMVFSIMSNGIVLIALASYDCELYMTLSASVSLWFDLLCTCSFSDSFFIFL
jgi:hypothetical protein